MDHGSSEATIRRNFTAAANVARTIGCLLVIAVHVNLYVRPAMENWWPGGFIGAPIYGSAVPIFFLISGFSTGGYSASIERPGILTFFRRKLKPLAIPFFFWNAVLILLLILDGGLPPVPVVAYRFLTGTWQLYYVFALLQMLFLKFCLGPYTKGRNLTWALGMAFAVSFAFYALADLSMWLFGDKGGFFETDLNRLFVPWMPFFALGVWLRQNPGGIEWLSKKLPWLVVFTALTWILYAWELACEAEWTGYNPLKQFLISGFAFQVFAPLLILVSLYRIVEGRKLRRSTRFLSDSGRDTYAVYLCHTTVLLLIFPIWCRVASPFDLYRIEVPVLAVFVWIICRLLIGTVAKLNLRFPGLILFGFSTRRTKSVR
jgi:peptidoglycan/LPS O-acetylase OafA/YrhL